MRLVRLVDRLLDLLDAEPDYPAFLLDAQTVVLEDYLAIRPEQESRLRAQVAAGRIEVGPWYVQPDQFLVSGESLVRNFLHARAVARRLGAPGDGLRVGYLPDMFGHMSQIPQLLRGFGIDNAILWRGISGPDAAPEFVWQSSDGSSVLTVHLPDRCGYSMIYRMSLDPEAALQQIREADAEPGHRTCCRLILLGSDHMEAQPGLPDLLARVSALPGAPMQVSLGGLGTFVRCLLADMQAKGLMPVGSARDRGLPVRLGELRDANRAPATAFNFVLPNVLSSRMPIKLQNAEAERELTVWAEPLAALARLGGAASERAFLQHAWKLVLHNHAHDSIGGCSRDEVHRQMTTRFESALQVARQVGDESAAHLAAQVDTSALPAEGRLLMLINPTPASRRQVVDVTCDFPEGDWRDIEVSGSDGTSVPAQVVEVLDTFRTTTMPDPGLFPVVATNPGAVPKPDSGWFTAFEGVRQVRMRFAADVPGCGYSTYRMRPVQRGRVNRGSLRTGSLTAANGVLALELSRSGELSLTHLFSGRCWRDCLRVEDGGDAGDGYTYAPPPEDEVLTWRPRAVAVVEDGPVAVTFRLEGDFMLPSGLEANRRRRSGERVACPVLLELTLMAGAPLVDVRVRCTNAARDHRLRLVVPAGLTPHWSAAEGAWDVVRRPTVVRHPSEDVWIEDAPTCHPTHGFVDAAEEVDGPGFAMIGLGLREYELSPHGDLSLTLLRAFGWVGAPEPLTIIDGAGPRIRTPEAQLLDTTIDVRAALMPHGAGADLWRLSQEWQHPCRAYPQSRHAGDQPLVATWLSVPAGLHVSALKEAEDGEGVILRLFNPGIASCGGRVHLGQPVHAAALVRLDESWLADLDLAADGSAAIQVSPKALASIRWSRMICPPRSIPHSAPYLPAGQIFGTSGRERP